MKLNEIFVCYVKENEILVMLDGEFWKLIIDNFVIINGKELVVLVGVMGGLDLEIMNEIIIVVLEFVLFDLILICCIVK